MCLSSFISRAHQLPCVCVCARYRADEACPSSPGGRLGRGGGGGPEQRLQVKIEAFEEKMVEEAGEEEEEEEEREEERQEQEEEVVLAAEGEGASPAPQRRYSLSQAVREERREMRFNRCVTPQISSRLFFLFLAFQSVTVLVLRCTSAPGRLLHAGKVEFLFCLILV